VIHHTTCGMEFFTTDVIRGLLVHSLEAAALTEHGFSGFLKSSGDRALGSSSNGSRSAISHRAREMMYSAFGASTRAREHSHRRLHLRREIGPAPPSARGETASRSRLIPTGMKRVHNRRVWVYVAWRLWGQNGKFWIAHFSNLLSESTGKLSDLGDYEIMGVGRGRPIRCGGWRQRSSKSRKFRSQLPT
jgi:hypothetical protein